VGGKAPGALAAHLTPKEPEIRHGGLAFGGLLHGGQFAALLICAGFAVGLPLMVALETEDSGPLAGIALAASVVIVAMSAGLMPRLTWRGRGTISALTDRRPLTVAGGRIVQDCGPEDVHGGPRRGGCAARRSCGGRCRSRASARRCPRGCAGSGSAGSAAWAAGAGRR
jgi:hypothetical protein